MTEEMTEIIEKMPTKREEMTEVEKKNRLRELFGTKLVNTAFSRIPITIRVVNDPSYGRGKLQGQFEACHAKFASSEHAFLKMACNNNKPSGPITSMRKGIAKLMRVPHNIEDFYTTNSECILRMRGSNAWQYVYMLFIIESLASKFPTFFFDGIWDEYRGNITEIDIIVRNISYIRALRLLVTEEGLLDKCTNDYLEKLQIGKEVFESIEQNSNFEMDAIYSEKEDIVEKVNPIKGDRKLSMASIYPQTSIYSQDDITIHEDNPIYEDTSIVKSPIPGRRTSGGRKKRKTRKMRKTRRKRRN